MSNKEVISFKADPDLAKFIKSLPNSSGFIREALMHAMDYSCPLCNGKGVMTKDELKHFNSFMKGHSIEKCKKHDCNIIKCEK